MKQFILKHKKAITSITAAVAICTICMSFQDSPFIYQRLGVQQVYEDTIPKKKINQTEFDKATKELEKAILQLSEQIKQVDINQLNAEISKAIKEIDVEKITSEVQQSLKEIDITKIMQDVNTSLKEVDMNKINKEIQDALKEIKIQQKDINTDEIKKELEKAKVEIEKAKKELPFSPYCHEKQKLD
jgi:hypothetical protein